LADIKNFILSTGAKLIVKKVGHNNIIALKLLFPAGPFLEPKNKEGLSNIAIKATINGTKRLSSGKLADQIESLGADLSLSVGKDLAVYSLQCTKDVLPRSLALFTEILSEPRFSQSGFLTEKMAALMEQKELDDQPMDFAFDNFRQIMFKNHPYAHRNIGTRDSVNSISRESAESHFWRLLDPALITISAVGDIDSGYLQDVFMKCFDKISKYRKQSGYIKKTGKGRHTGPRLNQTTNTNRNDGRITVLIKQSSAEWGVWGYLIPDIKSKDMPTLTILNTIMGGSMDSRLFVNLRDKKGLAYDIGSILWSGKMGGVWTIKWGTHPDNRDTMLAGVKKEIDKILTKRASKREIDSSIAYKIGTYLISQETNMGQASSYGYYEAIGLSYDYAEKYINMIKQVTPEKILEVANKYLKSETLVLVGPNK